MLEDVVLEKLFAPVLSWYEAGHRDLPWRRTKDPYAIWVSEIMLQQTRVEAVIPYYERFLEALPDVKALADCEQDALLKLWQGLGYYSRVRNMQKAAQVICSEYGGVFPETYDEIIKLAGIGPYTAAAISSIAFGEKRAAVDGNLLRIFSRVSMDSEDIAKDKTKAKYRAQIETAMERWQQEMQQSGAGDLNQAFMELGACVCAPGGEPRCGMCPWEKECLAHEAHQELSFPVKSGKIKRRIEEHTILLVEDGERILLHKRPDKGLLAGLYEFVNRDGILKEQEILVFTRQLGLEPLFVKELPEAKHIFSHVEWHMRGYYVRVASLDFLEDRLKGEELAELESDSVYLMVECDKIEKEYAIPSAFQAYAGYVSLKVGAQKETS